MPPTSRRPAAPSSGRLDLPPPLGRPRLLVSVRSAAEAAAALAGGCDLLDVKEPTQGPLGMADLNVTEAVCAFAAGRSVSVALGDLGDWSGTRPVPALPPGVTFAKLGLRAPTADWIADWTTLRRRLDAAAGRRLAWVAVIYADAPAPPPAAVLQAAAATGCAAVLIDTAVKDGRRLFDHATPQTLAAWRDAAGLPFAVAGSLRPGDLPLLNALRPDIVAVRGAACAAGDRTGVIDEAAVRRLRIVLDRFAEDAPAERLAARP